MVALRPLPRREPLRCVTPGPSVELEFAWPGITYVGMRTAFMDLARPSGLHARSWVTWLALDTARRRRQASAAARRARAEACDVVTQPPQWRASVGWTQFSQGGNVDAGLFAPGHARVCAARGSGGRGIGQARPLHQPAERRCAGDRGRLQPAASRRRGGVDPRRHHQGHGQAARRAGRRGAAGGRAADRRYPDDGGARSRRASCSPIRRRRRTPIPPVCTIRTATTSRPS